VSQVLVLRHRGGRRARAIQPIDPSADVGEIEGPVGRALDAALMARVTTAHIATGGHAGDRDSMRASIEACVVSLTRVGAHPPRPDREGFGRRRMGADAHLVVDSLAVQPGEIDEIAQELAAVVESITPHGQLYHDLGEDPELVAAVAAWLSRRVLSDKRQAEETWVGAAATLADSYDAVLDSEG